MARPMCSDVCRWPETACGICGRCHAEKGEPRFWMLRNKVGFKLEVATTTSFQDAGSL